MKETGEWTERTKPLTPRQLQPGDGGARVNPKELFPLNAFFPADLLPNSKPSAPKKFSHRNRMWRHVHEMEFAIDGNTKTRRSNSPEIIKKAETAIAKTLIMNCTWETFKDNTGYLRIEPDEPLSDISKQAVMNYLMDFAEAKEKTGAYKWPVPHRPVEVSHPKRTNLPPLSITTDFIDSIEGRKPSDVTYAEMSANSTKWLKEANPLLICEEDLLLKVREDITRQMKANDRPR